MMRRWLAQHGWGLAVGLGLTLTAVLLQITGATETIELLGYGYHVRHFSRIPASERIVHIDIDDDAFKRVGSWPWPRDIQGELVRILHELGATHVPIDIVWLEPKPPEVRMPALDRYADIEGTIDQVGELSEENVVYPDDELARAIADAGNVYLSFYYEAPDKTSGQIAQSSLLRRRIAELCRTDFSLDAGQIAQRLTEGAKAVEAVLAGVKRQVACDLVRAQLEANPAASVRQVHEAILPGTPFERLTADRADVVDAYHQELGLREVRSKCPPVPQALRGKLPVASRVLPAVYKFTAGACRTAFVNFEDDPDGITRHIPLLVEWEGRLLEQLAFSVARDVLDIRLEDLSIDQSGDLVIAPRGDRAEMRIQLDQDGQALINWHVTSKGWLECFTHLPVTQLLRIYDCRARARENGILRQITISKAMESVMEPQGFADYCQQHRAMLEYERLVHWATLQGRGETAEVKRAQDQAAELRQSIDRTQKETLALVAETWAELEKEPDPNDPEIKDDYQRYKTAHALIADEVAKIDQANGTIAAEERRLIDQLRPLVAGKICFIGYTATAVADVVTTPAYRRLPGVCVHSTVLNSFLQGQFRTWARRPAQIAVITFLGVLVTTLTLTRGPWVGLALVLSTIIAGFSLNALAVFERMDHWLRLGTALGLAFVVWAIIVLLRYLTTDRQKRRFSKAVAQYVSPAMAKRIAESAATLDLSPVNGQVTCFFSDLQGFTTISESLGPEGTKTVLNPYLEAMSTILHEHQALINKFMGDGIFAFFNPPILACEQHELAACEAAIESQRALRKIIADYRDHPLAHEFQRLFMRVGIASGHVFVGDYGSASKLDYTCMGDTVNLASRLEGANKQFGSATMVAGSTRDVVAGRYVWRHIGALQVKGQTVAVQVYELLGRPGEVDDETIRFADLYTQAVEAFARRDWDQSAAKFQGYLERRPGDPGAARYLAAISAFQKQPPPDDWVGTLELTEK